MLSVLSEITTCVALLAVTLSIVGVPSATVVGLAAMVTVGNAGGGGVFAVPVPQAVSAESAIVATQTIAADLHRLADTVAAVAGSLALYVETTKGSVVAA